MDLFVEYIHYQLTGKSEDSHDDCLIFMVATKHFMCGLQLNLDSKFNRRECEVELVWPNVLRWKLFWCWVGLIYVDVLMPGFKVVLFIYYTKMHKEY